MSRLDKREKRAKAREVSLTWRSPSGRGRQKNNPCRLKHNPFAIWHTPRHTKGGASGDAAKATRRRVGTPCSLQKPTPYEMPAIHTDFDAVRQTPRQSAQNKTPKQKHQGEEKKKKKLQAGFRTPSKSQEEVSIWSDG